MIRQLLNLPLLTMNRIARVIQDREDQRLRAEHGEGDTSDESTSSLAMTDLPLPEGLDLEAARMTATDALARRRKGQAITFVDLRALDQWREAHIPAALHMEGNSLTIRLSELPPDRPSVVYCNDGKLSQRAAGFLRYRGLEDAWYLAGGINGWKKAGGDVTAR